MTVNKGAFYFIALLQLLVLGALLIGAAFLVDTRTDQTVTRSQLREACERNNLLRDAVRFNTAVTVESALLEGDQQTFREGARKLAALTLAASRSPQKDRPWLVDCTAAYP